jgi:hypothetical protein
MFIDDSVDYSVPHALVPIVLKQGTRRQLPFYFDFLRGSETPLWCDVIPFEPRLDMYWRYTEEQTASALRWGCTTAWLHSAAHDNGANNAPLYRDLCIALNQLSLTRSSDAVRYSLLVRTDGMPYDTNRLGGDFHVTTPSGRKFTFSVRRDHGDRKLLLAISWN